MSANDILVKVGADITGFSKAMSNANKSLKDFTKENQETFDAFKTTGTIITGAGIALAGGLGVAVKEASNWESAFAGVKKTVNMSESEFATLEKGIRDMAKELPASATEIAGVAEAAGQLGISKENILEFSRTMIDLSETTNMTADEAATQFARFANITKMPQDSFDKLGSVVVDLGNNMATTEGEITNMAMRLAAQGKQVGMSEAEIMALAGTMSSLGIESEAGGSAMTQVLTKMQKAVMGGGKELDDFAKAAGMSSKDFAESFKNDPVKALEQLSSGLGDSADAGGNMSAILEDLGIKGLREADVMKRLAGNSELLGEAVGIANGAWDENSALSNEAAQRYETFESKMAMFKNTLKDVGITIGNALLPFVTGLVEKLSGLFNWVSNLNPTLLKWVAIFAAVAAAVMLVVGPILLLIGFIPSILAGFAALKVVFAAVATAMGAISWPIVLIVAAVIGLAVLIYKYWDEIKAYTIKTWKAAIEGVLAAWDWLKAAWASTVEWFKALWSSISEFFSNLWTGIVEGAKTAWDSFTSKINEIWEAIKTAASTAWNAIVNAIMTIVQPFINGFMNIWNGMRDGLFSMFEGLAQFFGGVWDLIKNIFLGALLLLINLVTGNFEELKSNAIAIFGNIKDALTNIWEGLKTYFLGALSAILGFFSGYWKNVMAVSTTVFNALKNFLTGLWNGIKTMFTNVVNAIKNGIKSGWENIKTMTSTVFNAVRTLLSTIWNGIKTFFTTTLSNIWSTVKQKFDDIKTSIKTKMDEARTNIETAWNKAKTFLTNIDLAKIGRDIIQGLINGIKDKIAAVGNAVKDVASKITGKIKSILNIQSPSRVMRDQVGVHIGGGIAAGITKSTPKVTAAMSAQGNALKKAASEAIKNLEVKFDTNKIGASKYINELKRIQKQYKLTGDQSRKVQKELFQAGKVQAKQAEDFKKSITKINDGVKSADSKLLNIVKSINSKLKADIKKVNDSFKKELSGLASSIYNQVGLFDEVKSEKVDGSALLKNVRAQNQQFSAFKRDLGKIQSAGVSKAFLDELKAMGVGAADEINAIANMPKSMLDDYVKAWKQKHALANAAANEQMAKAKENTTKQINALTRAATAELSKAKTDWVTQLKKFADTAKALGDFRVSGKVLGKDVIAGLVKGLRSMSGPLADAAKTLAKSVASTIKSTLKIKSPSRVMAELGRFTGEGLAMGIADMRSMVERSAEELAQSAVVKPDLSYATPNANYGSLSKALSGEVNVNQRDSMLVGAIESLERKLTNLRVDMDKQEVGRMVAPTVSEHIHGQRTQAIRGRGGRRI